MCQVIKIIRHVLDRDGKGKDYTWLYWNQFQSLCKHYPTRGPRFVYKLALFSFNVELGLARVQGKRKTIR